MIYTTVIDGGDAGGPCFLMFLRVVIERREGGAWSVVFGK